MQSRRSSLKRIMISQSNYIPWKGFFDAINAVDEYIVYDDMQYTRRDWRNRNRIKTPQGAIWLTIPVEVKGKFNQKINETKISDSTWAQKHWMTIKHSYARAPYFKEMKDFFEDIYSEAGSLIYLSDVNLLFLDRISSLLDIKTKFISSSNFEILEGKTEKLVDICKKCAGTDYYSGPAARGYIDETLFERENMRVHYFDFSSYEEYPQLYPPFDHAVSIVDTLFTLGPSCHKFIFKNSGELFVGGI